MNEIANFTIDRVPVTPTIKSIPSWTERYGKFAECHKIVDEALLRLKSFCGEYVPADTQQELESARKTLKHSVAAIEEDKEKYKGMDGMGMLEEAIQAIHKDIRAVREVVYVVETPCREQFFYNGAIGRIFEVVNDLIFVSLPKLAEATNRLVIRVKSESPMLPDGSNPMEWNLRQDEQRI